MQKKKPLLPEEVGIVVLKRKNARDNTLHQYTVVRKVVEDALKSLCYGFPVGGIETHDVGFTLYDGPNHLNKLLNGRYFLYTPNPYYHDVIIDENRLHTIPFCREQFSVKVIEVDGNMEEDDKGPAEEQFKTSDGNLDDEKFTVSDVAVRQFDR